MMWLDFELQCFDKSKQAKQRPGLGKSDRWPVIGVSLAIGHHHNQWPQTRDWSHTGVSSYLPDCPAELQSAVFTLMSCSFLGHQQQACQCGEVGGLKNDAWKEIVRQKSKVYFFLAIIIMRYLYWSVQKHLSFRLDNFDYDEISLGSEESSPHLEMALLSHTLQYLTGRLS